MDRVVDEPQLMSRIIWRVMPILMLVYLVAVIDRSNIGFAKLQMARELDMSERAFGLASSLFFIGYLICEIPSTLAVHRFGARAWLTRILLSWGAVTVAMAFVNSDWMFTVMRFLLGIAEAGAYPGIIYVTSIWFPQSYRVRDGHHHARQRLRQHVRRAGVRPPARHARIARPLRLAMGVHRDGHACGVARLPRIGAIAEPAR